MSKHSVAIKHSPSAIKNAPRELEKSKIHAHCRIFTREEFLSSPSDVEELWANGTQVCIRAGHATIIVGSSHRSVDRRGRWSFVRKLRFKIGRIFRPANGPLDVSWIE